MTLFLNKQQIAEALGTSPGVASAILLERGINPIDLGPGRSKGLRWYAEAVRQVAFEIHVEAQPKEKELKKSHRVKITKPGFVSGRSASELYAELTECAPVQ